MAEYLTIFGRKTNLAESRDFANIVTEIANTHAEASGWPEGLAAAYLGKILNYEIESFETNGISYIWVQIPELTNNLSIWAIWGNVFATNQESYTTNGAVWSEGYEAVYHFAGSTYDSTGGSPCRKKPRYYVSVSGKHLAAGQRVQSAECEIGIERAATRGDIQRNQRWIQYFQPLCRLVIKRV